MGARIIFILTALISIITQLQAEYIARSTFSEKQLKKFCSTKDPGERKIGHHHPYFCAKYIYCWMEIATFGSELMYEERMCPECHSHPQKGRIMHQSCHHLHWDETSQTCVMPRLSRTGDECRQEEKPKNNIWGRQDLANLCPRNEILPGGERTFTYPDHCGQYIECYKDIVYSDIYVSVKSCPPCDPTDPLCPDGYMHYLTSGNGTCGKPTDNENPCVPPTHRRSKEASFLRPVFLTTIRSISIDEILEPVIGNETDLAKNFCQQKTVETKRYPHPQACNKYIQCWHGLVDQEGDEVVSNKTHHLEFECPPCDQADIEAKKCPENGYLRLNVKEQECDIPMGNACRPNVVVMGAEKSEKTEKSEIDTISVPDRDPSIPEWRQPLLTDEAVLEFCNKTNKTGDHPHPTDKSCGRYITCWFEMNYFKEKTCEPCDHHPTECPNRHLHFDTESKKCASASAVTTCISQEVSLKPSDVPTTISPLVGQDQEETQPPDTEPINEELLEPKHCNLKHYVERGYCKTYFTCDKKTGFEKLHQCSGRLFWNPDKNAIHGGTCDFLKNIDNYTLYQYKKDPGCPLHIAYFRMDEKECSGTYFYHHPQRTKGTEVKLHCPEDLLWSKEKKTCVLCQDATKPDGSPCCKNPDKYNER